MRAGEDDIQLRPRRASLTLTTVRLQHLAPLHAGLGVVPRPIVVQPAAPAPAPAPLTVVGRPAEQPALHAVNDARAEAAPLACSFVRDVTMSGPGYVFHGEDLVTDGSHLSDVAEQWLTRPMPDSPLVTPPARETFVREPCILAVGPGHLIYGHWLVDFIPRFAIARAALGSEFARYRVALPHDTPRWALTMLDTVVGVGHAQCVFYERGVERLAVEQACIPSYGHTDYQFHPWVAGIYDGVGKPAAGPGTRKLCISRAAFEGATHGVQKLFNNRAEFEQTAVAHGFEIVRPESMSFAEQVALFRSASQVIGEYGSALHSAVFSPPGLKAGFIRCPNQIQLRLSALCRQQSVAVLPEDDRVAPNGVQEYSLAPDELEGFFAALA